MTGYVRGARSNVTDDAGFRGDPDECDYCPDLHYPDEDCPTWAPLLEEAS